MTSYPAGGIVPHYTQGTEFYSHDEAKVLAETKVMTSRHMI